MSKKTHTISSSVSDSSVTNLPSVQSELCDGVATRKPLTPSWELAAGNEASCESEIDEHHGDEQQPPEVVIRALEAFKRENPEMDATAFDDGKIVISDDGIVHVNVDVLEKRFDLNRDAIDNLEVLHYWSHPNVDPLGPFPAPVQLGDEDYWRFDDVKAWVINYRHIFAVRVVQADVSKALAIFDEWVKEKQCSAWGWQTIFVQPTEVELKLPSNL